MSVFREWERRVDERLRKVFQPGGAEAESPVQRRELIEIQRAILDDVADHAQMLPRARRVLPFNEIAIRIPVPEPDRRTAFRLVFLEGNALAGEIAAHLRREEIEVPGGLRVNVELLEHDVPEFAARGFHIAYSTADEKAKLEPPPLRRVRFGLPSGEEVTVERARIHVGRTAEVLDDRRRLVRRNDLVLEGDTVSRAHAHIEYAAGTGEFRLYDDGSSYGTSVIHSGRLSEVPKAGGRGLKLEAGDEIYFGQVRVRFGVD